MKKRLSTVEKHEKICGKNPAAEECPKPKANKKSADPRVKQLIDYFHDKHLEIHGEKYHVLGGRDGNSIKRILNTVPDVEEIEKRMERYLRDPLGWMDRPQWSIPRFENSINRYREGNTARCKPSLSTRLARMKGAWK